MDNINLEELFIIIDNNIDDIIFIDNIIDYISQNFENIDYNLFIQKIIILGKLMKRIEHKKIDYTYNSLEMEVERNWKRFLKKCEEDNLYRYNNNKLRSRL